MLGNIKNNKTNNLSKVMTILSDENIKISNFKDFIEKITFLFDNNITSQEILDNEFNFKVLVQNKELRFVDFFENKGLMFKLSEMKTFQTAVIKYIKSPTADQEKALEKKIINIIYKKVTLLYKKETNPKSNAADFKKGLIYFSDINQAGIIEFINDLETKLSLNETKELFDTLNQYDIPQIKILLNEYNKLIENSKKDAYSVVTTRGRDALIDIIFEKPELREHSTFLFNSQNSNFLLEKLIYNFSNKKRQFSLSKQDILNFKAFIDQEKFNHNSNIHSMLSNTFVLQNQDMKEIIHYLYSKQPQQHNGKIIYRIASLTAPVLIEDEKQILNFQSSEISISDGIFPHVSLMDDKFKKVFINAMNVVFKSSLFSKIYVSKKTLFQIKKLYNIFTNESLLFSQDKIEFIDIIQDPEKAPLVEGRSNTYYDEETHSVRSSYDKYLDDFSTQIISVNL